MKSTTTRNQGLATISQACDFLGIGKSSLYVLRSDSEAKAAKDISTEDKIQVVRLPSGMPRITWDELYRFVERQEQKARRAVK